MPGAAYQQNFGYGKPTDNKVAKGRKKVGRVGGKLGGSKLGGGKMRVSKFGGKRR